MTERIGQPDQSSRELEVEQVAGRLPGPQPAQPHFLAIYWDATAEDGTPVTLQAMLCKAHRQVIALKSSSARGVRRQFGESCDLCAGREPTPLPHRGE